MCFLIRSGVHFCRKPLLHTSELWTNTTQIEEVREGKGGRKQTRESTEREKKGKRGKERRTHTEGGTPKKVHTAPRAVDVLCPPYLTSSFRGGTGVSRVFSERQPYFPLVFLSLKSSSLTWSPFSRGRGSRAPSDTGKVIDTVESGPLPTGPCFRESPLVLRTSDVKAL